MKEILRLFPETLTLKLNKKLNNRWDELQEIRLRLMKPIELSFGQSVEWLDDVYFSVELRNYFLGQLSEHSLYRFENELKEGFITIEGGHRVGLAGKMTLEHEKVKGLQFLTSFNIRIARQIFGVAKPIFNYLHKGEQYFHTLIVGAPQSGKTTILRDIARLIGNGFSSMKAQKVAIIDERSEIAASNQGIPQFDIGMRTDVMDNCPKSEGMMMVIRSMSPNVLIVDEIGKEKDVDALLDVFHAGISIICTAHGSSLSEVKKRRSLQKLFSDSIFNRFILLRKHMGHPVTYEIYDDRFSLLKRDMGIEK